MSVATQRNTQLDTERRNDRLSMRAAREAQNSLETTLTNVRGRQDGLDQAEAAARLHADGPNEVAHDRPPHVLVQLLQAFNNPFIYVLMTLSAISFFTDFWLPLQDGEETDLTGVIIVLCMVLVSGLMRFWQEYRSGKAAEALKAMVRNTATVLRRDERGMRGELREIPMGELVVGDIVRLSAGDMIPADIRLIESRDLFISQAVLTGEALPVEKYDTLGAVREKSAKRIAADQQDLLELPNICFMGTNVVSGTATAVVVATGARTYFGSLARSIVGSRAQTAFDRGVNSVSWLLIRFMLVMVPIVLLINGFTKGDWTEAFMFALAVAVGLTPEMLPMIVSANLAKGAVAMSRRKVVVKRLNAIQNFGAMDVLCTDKTGTLTQDRIILEHHVDVAVPALRPGPANGLAEQLPPVRDEEPDGPRGGRLRRTEPAHHAAGCLAQGRRTALRFRPSASLGDPRGQGRRTPAGVQGRGRGNARDRHPRAPGRRRPAARRGTPPGPAGAGRAIQPRRLPRAPARHPQPLAHGVPGPVRRQRRARPGDRRPADLPRSAEGNRRPGHRRVARERRGGEGAHRRQPGGQREDLPRGRPGRRRAAARSRHRPDGRCHPATPGRGAHGVRQADAAAEVAGAQGPAGQRTHRRLPRRRHQRRPRAARCRCRHLGGQRHRHRQGIDSTSSSWKKA